MRVVSIPFVLFAVFVSSSAAANPLFLKCTDTKSSSDFIFFVDQIQGRISQWNKDRSEWITLCSDSECTFQPTYFRSSTYVRLDTSWDRRVIEINRTEGSFHEDYSGAVQYQGEFSLTWTGPCVPTGDPRDNVPAPKF